MKGICANRGGLLNRSLNILEQLFQKGYFCALSLLRLLSVEFLGSVVVLPRLKCLWSVWV